MFGHSKGTVDVGIILFDLKISVSIRDAIIHHLNTDSDDTNTPTTRCRLKTFSSVVGKENLGLYQHMYWPSCYFLVMVHLEER